MPSTFGIAPLIPGLVDEVALEILLHFVTVDWDGPFTLVLVCAAWRDMALRSNFLRSLRRNRRGGNPALRGNREKSGEGICIVSFDGGGPGSLSQLRILDELMLRLAFKPGVKVDELRPADYFDLMGGVGFGGLVALLLGRMRMTTSQAMDELAAIGTTTFPEGDDMVTREVNMARLRCAIESMLERHGHPVDIKLHDSSGNRCKVVLFAAPTVAMDHCHVFRTYLAPRKSLECTFVDVACATMAIPEYFSSVTIGPRWRKQDFAGIAHGFDNPMREVLKESQLVFGETIPVSLVLSLGSGQRARPSDLKQHVTRSSSIHCDGVASGLQYQFQGVAEYLRLNVDNGMGNIELDDWSKLGSIETFTNVYLEMNLITKYIDKACQWLRKRNGSVTLGQLTGTNTDCVVKFHSESLENYLKMEFKQMHTIIQQLGIKWITLVDPIGNDIPIPISLCLNYKMLSEVISVYFRHQKVPGSDFVKRRDYRLVHGGRKTIVDPMEWTRVEKVGLKVEMSMILRRRNQNITRCPSCSTSFGGHATDGWAQCLSCSTQFQIETQVQVEPQVRSEDMNQSDEEALTELVTPAVEAGHIDASGVTPDSPTRREFESGQPRMREHTNSGDTVQLQFRLIPVINTTAVLSSPQPPTSPPSPAPQPNNLHGFVFRKGDAVPPSSKKIRLPWNEQPARQLPPGGMQRWQVQRQLTNAIQDDMQTMSYNPVHHPNENLAALAVPPRQTPTRRRSKSDSTHFVQLHAPQQTPGDFTGQVHSSPRTHSNTLEPFYPMNFGTEQEEDNNIQADGPGIKLRKTLPSTKDPRQTVSAVPSFVVEDWSDRAQVQAHHPRLVASRFHQGPSTTAHGAPVHGNYGASQPGPSMYAISGHQSIPQQQPFNQTMTYPSPNSVPDLQFAGPSNLGRNNSNSKQNQQGQRNEVDERKLAEAFMPGSFRSDPALQFFLNLIRTCHFYLEDEPEPLVGTPEAEQLFAQVRSLYPHDLRFTPRNDSGFSSLPLDNETRDSLSIFMLLTAKNQCLICGVQKDRTGRALGHVRSDIGHRPYHCTCEKCMQSANPRRFFSDNLLDDHLKGQQVKQECVYCHNLFRRGGMRRHLISKHPEHVQSAQE